MQGQQKTARASAGATVNETRRRPIVIVDDDEDDIEHLRREMAFLFGETPMLAFHSGVGLLRYLEQTLRMDGPKPLFILLDLKMRELNGARTLELLHARSCLQGIPVIVVSGSHDSREIHDAFVSGAAAYLPKPLTRVDFIHTLRQKGIHVEDYPDPLQ